MYNWLDGSDVYNTGSSNSELIGSVNIPVSKLKESESLLNFELICHKYGNYRKNPNFSVTLKRCYMHKAPPICKTIFLIRHGESTWNQAQEQKNVAGLIAYDHALTQRGIDQATVLNSRWKQFAAEYTTMATEAKYEVSVTGDGSDYTTTPAQQQATVLQVAEEIFADENYPLDFIPKNTHHEDYNDGEMNDEVSGRPEELKDHEAIIKECYEGDPASISDDDDEGVDAAPSKDLVGFISQSIRKSLKPPRVSVSEQGGVGRRSSYTTLAQYMTTTYKGSSIRSSTQKMLRGSITDIFRSNPRQSVRASISSPARMPARNRKNRRHYLRRLFMKSNTIYTSPLTRAVQTALVALAQHPAGRCNGITLYSPIREFKSPGGFDTIGVACGETAIRKRIHEEFTKHISQERSQELLSCHHLHAADASHPWWTPVSSYDNKQDKEERMREFANFIRYCEDTSPIFVGHSLFFKTFCNRRISTYLARNRPALVANMRKYKLGNAVLLAVTLVFTNSDVGNGCCDGKIVDADLICGGGFEGGDSFDGDEREDVVRIESTRNLATGTELIGIDVTKPEEIQIAGPEGEKKKGGLVSQLFAGVFRK